MTDTKPPRLKGAIPSKEAALRLEIQDLKAQLQGIEHLKIEALRDLQQRLLETQQAALAKEEAWVFQQKETEGRLLESLERLESLEAECLKQKVSQETFKEKWLKGLAENRRLSDEWEEIADDRLRLAETIVNLEESLNTLREQRDAEQEKSQKIREELSKVYRSLSWRLTRPLRALKALFSRF